MARESLRHSMLVVSQVTYVGVLAPRTKETSKRRKIARKLCVSSCLNSVLIWDNAKSDVVS
jgi:hypothetical protein